MSHENVALAAAAYQVINLRDLDGFLAMVDPDVDFRSLVAEAEGRKFHGHAGVRQWWQSVAESLGGLRWEPEQITAVGDGGVTRLRIVGTVDGVEVPQTVWQAFRVRDGLFVWWDVFRTEAEAVAALGEPG